MYSSRKDTVVIESALEKEVFSTAHIFDIDEEVVVLDSQDGTKTFLFGEAFLDYLFRVRYELLIIFQQPSYAITCSYIIVQLFIAILKNDSPSGLM